MQTPVTPSSYMIYKEELETKRFMDGFKETEKELERALSEIELMRVKSRLLRCHPTPWPRKYKSFYVDEAKAKQQRLRLSNDLRYVRYKIDSIKMFQTNRREHARSTIEYAHK